MAEAETQPINDLIKQVRQGETGKTLTASQFGEAWSIAGIMHHTITKTGAFRDKLTDFAHAYARSERFDALTGENIVRGIFTERYGEMMNEMRERLQHNQENLPEHARAQALEVAKTIEPMIKQGETMPFYQVYDRVGRQLAKSLDITEHRCPRPTTERKPESGELMRVRRHGVGRAPSATPCNRLERVQVTDECSRKRSNFMENNDFFLA